MSVSLDVQDISNLVSSVANQAIVQPLGDPYTIGISGLIFDIVGDVGVEINSDITDHYVENNYAIQDHWAQKPIIVTMQGYAAEVVSVYQPNIIQQIFSAISNFIPLSGLGPSFNSQDSAFYTALQSISQIGQNIANTTLNAFSIFQNAATIVTKQQTVFQFLLNMWKTRQLATVETPYAVFENMAIESIRPTQSRETTKVSEFIVRFKQIMTVSSVTITPNVDSTDAQNIGTTSSNPPVVAPAAESYTADPVNLGNTAGNPSPVNFSNSTILLPASTSYLPTTPELEPSISATPTVPTFSVQNTLQPIFQNQANLPALPGLL